jgi:hypothetical protein
MPARLINTLPWSGFMPRPYHLILRVSFARVCLLRLSSARVQRVQQVYSYHATPLYDMPSIVVVSGRQSG